MILSFALGWTTRNSNTALKTFARIFWNAGTNYFRSPFNDLNVALFLCLRGCAIACAPKQTFSQFEILLGGTLVMSFLVPAMFPLEVVAGHQILCNTTREIVSKWFSTIFRFQCRKTKKLARHVWKKIYNLLFHSHILASFSVSHVSTLFRFYLFQLPRMTSCTGLCVLGLVKDWSGVREKNGSVTVVFWLQLFISAF